MLLDTLVVGGDRCGIVAKPSLLEGLLDFTFAAVFGGAGGVAAGRMGLFDQASARTVNVTGLRFV